MRHELERLLKRVESVGNDIPQTKIVLKQLRDILESDNIDYVEELYDLNRDMEHNKYYSGFAFDDTEIRRSISKANSDFIFKVDNLELREDND